MTADPLKLISAGRVLTEEEDRRVARACREALKEYRAAVARGNPGARLISRARRAFLHLGGDPDRRTVSLKDYDHVRYGPFLGISDEGSAAGAIRKAALGSPKAKALPKNRRAPITVGVAIDAERLVGIGETAVGPEEYADIWLASVDRLLITTNIGTRVNMRVYKGEPRIIIKDDSREAIVKAKEEIAAAFKPFVDTPDRKPRPRTVFVDIPRYIPMSPEKKRSLLKKLEKFVSSGKAAGRKRVPKGQSLGLVAWVKLGPPGGKESEEAIDLAASARLRTVLLDGVKRKEAHAAVSLAGLLEYFRPGIVGPILRRAKEKKVQVRAANLPDTETIARSVWVGLTTARNMGANLGKYGCFPLTQAETDRVVGRIQSWLPGWSAAPVFFVDQGLLSEESVDVEKDLTRGLKRWLKTVKAKGVRVVLIDTVDKATGRRLLKRSGTDTMGYLGKLQLQRIDDFAKDLGVRVLWAGGLGLRDAFEMGKLGVFGIYVTTAAATTIAVSGSYEYDPSLAGLKEPTREGVYRAKLMLEAGFLSTKLGGNLEQLAEKFLSSVESNDQEAIQKNEAALASACEGAWRAYWRK